jgi:choline dehydrogenase
MLAILLAHVFAKCSDYDYIVVGSGPGGGPLSVNLAKAGYKVLLLEAGDVENGTNVTIPALSNVSVEDEKMRWDYNVKHYPEGKRQNVLYPRAAALGGCAAHNAMIVHTPHKTDFDGMADQLKDDSWSDDNMRKYFTRIENSKEILWSRKAKDHGFAGWLYTSILDLTAAIFPKFDLALNALVSAPIGNLPYINDLNAVGNNMKEGFSFCPQNVFKGRRSGLVDHLIEAKESVSNLKIQTETFVTKIILEGTKAVGVEAVQGKALYKADPRNNEGKGNVVKYFANREVIISAGSYNTPQLLMLSGIGDSKQLKEFGIETKVELPGVGSNLMDRYEVGVISKIKGGFKALDRCKFTGGDDDKCAKSRTRREQVSPIYSGNGVVVGNVKKFDKSSPAPDAYVFAAPLYFQGYYRGYSKEVLNKPGHQTWAILKAHTKNKGKVSLKSSNPFDTPDIMFNYFPGGLNDPDLQVVADGVEYARKLNRGNLWSSFIETEVMPGENIKGEALKEWIMNTAWGHHACCTAKIGPDSDKMAVLNSNFEVRGAQNLRVVDASIFPEIPGFFIQTPIYMISEKASDVIIQHAKKTQLTC